MKGTNGDNIKTDLKETGKWDVDCTHLAHEHSNEHSFSTSGLGFLA